MDPRPRCRRHRNYSVCRCGGCALKGCCPHEEDPVLIAEFVKRNLLVARKSEPTETFNERHRSVSDRRAGSNKTWAGLKV
jgi:hypothetical protein